MKRYVRAKVQASKYYEDADTYVVKIWHEVEGMRGGLPSAAEEIFDIVAGSPDEALERAKMLWKGPIDRIEIVDVNPDEYTEETCYASTNSIADMRKQVADARRALTQYDPKQVKYVRECMDDIYRDINTYYENEDDDSTGINTSSIKTDYLIGALEGDLMTEDEFNEIFDLLDTVDNEQAWSVS